MEIDVKALHRRGDKSGAPRYLRARNRMVKHLHAAHRDVLGGSFDLTSLTQEADGGRDQIE